MAVLRILAGAAGVLSIGAGLFWIVLLRKARRRRPPERNLALFVAVGTLGYFAFGALLVAAAVWRLRWAVGAAGGRRRWRVQPERLPRALPRAAAPGR